MNKQYRLLIFVFLTIILQVFLMENFLGVSLQYPFLLGVPISSNIQMNHQFLIYWYLPIAALTFYFSDFVNQAFQKKGILKIIRNYDVKKWVLKRFLFIACILLIYILFQVVLFSSINSYKQSISIDQFLLLLNYFFMLLSLIGLQMVLELTFSSKIAILCINIYIVGSILLTQEIYVNDWSNLYFIVYFMIPNYGMGFKTGYNISHLNTEIINRHADLPVLIIVNLIIVFFVLKRMKKIDILP